MLPSSAATSASVESLELEVPFVRTADNIADFFTKPLKSKAFFGLRNKIMNIA